MPSKLSLTDNEATRLAALDRYDILDTPPEQGFDDITRLAAQFCDAPIGLITFVDDHRQFFKARIGFDGEANSPLDVGFCPSVVQLGQPVIIPNTAADAAHKDNLAVRTGGVRFYAGVPLLTFDDQTLGTLCVLDTRARPNGLTAQQQEALQTLSREIIARLELRRETEERKRSEARLISAIAIARLGTYDWDAASGAVTIDARGRAIFGLPATGAVRQADVFGRIAPADIERVSAAALAGFEAGTRVEIDYGVIRPDGSTRVVRSVGDAVAEPDGTRRMRGVFQDITDLKRAADVMRASHDELEQQVQASVREFDRAWRLSQELLVVALPNGTLKAVNPLWTTLLGWSQRELVGSKFVEYAHPDDLEATLVAFAGIFEKPLTVPYEYRLRHKDGTYRWFAWTGAFEDGKVYASGRDTTLERQQAEQMRQSQKLEAVGQLTGGVAHDFNNLLTVIRSSTDLLKRPDLPEERRQRYISAISETVERAAKLTAQLLAFARRQTLKPEVFAACDSVRSLSGMMETLTGSRIEIVTELPEKPCFVQADPSQFDTALVNMAVNARDAMDGQGRLTIRVEAVERMPAVRAHAALTGSFVAVSICDTGSGIPEEQLDQIFEPFFTTKGVGQGTGLGLSQVFGFTKQSGGEITVTSDVGRGSTFTLYLPRVAEPSESKGEGEPEPLMDGHGTCVLVVEDNAEVGTFAVQTLTDLGYVPVLANNAEEALAELARDADRFDVVFSDVVMPGMNGIDLAHEIRRLHHDLPVLLASGYSHVLAQNGTYGFELLHKPYSVEQLSRLLRKVATWQRRKRVMGKQQRS